MAACAVVVACGDDGGGGLPEGGMDAGDDSGMDGSTDAEMDAARDASDGGDPGDGGDAGDGGMNQVERGRYLVRVVAGCADCHTPRTEDGLIDESMLMAGNPMYADIVPDDDSMGLLTTPNLTPGGVADDYTDEQLARAFTEGLDNEGEALHAIMPYWSYANMRDEDVEAIVAFIRSLDPIDNEIPEWQPPLDEHPPEPAGLLAEEDVPQTTLEPDDPEYEVAQRGRYLAGMAGACMECHTRRVEEPAPGELVIDPAEAFAGGEAFVPEWMFLPPDAFPNPIWSLNITPHEDGIQGWTTEQVVAALKEGLDDEGQPFCPPMPAGPMMALGDMTDEDAEAIGIYLTTLEPKPIPDDVYDPGGGDAGAGDNCVPPPPPEE